VLDGFAVPTPDARFAWKGGAPGSISVSFAPDDDVELVPAGSLDAVALPCDAVMLGWPSFDARAAAPRGRGAREAVLRAGQIIPLSRTPGGPSIAMLRPAPGTAEEISVIETRGRRSLVVRAGERAVIFGWIPAADALPPPPERAPETFRCGVLDLEDAPEPRSIARCDRALPLVAEVAGERRTVGSIAAGTPIPLGDRRGDLVSVLPPERLAIAATGATLGVLASHLRGCSR
jgi:hypothetical protein